MNRPFKFIDLFAGGCGGFSLGLERTGKVETVGMVELDKERQQNLAEKFQGKYIFGDITGVKYKDGKIFCKDNFKDGVHVGKIDGLSGGFPCTDISIAGDKKGFEDEQGKRTRSGLWKEYYRLIKEVKPRIVIIENVANLYSLGLAEVIKDLARLNYVGEGHTLPACAFGASHLRKRIFIVAYLEGTRTRINKPRVRGFSNGESVKGNGDTMQEVSEPITNGIIPDANMLRLWRPQESQETASRWWAKATSGFRDVFLKAFEIEPAVLRTLHGLPGRMDFDRKRQGEAERIRKRIKRIDCELEKIRSRRVSWLGDSIVPQIPEFIGNQIFEKLELE